MSEKLVTIRRPLALETHSGLLIAAKAIEYYPEQVKLRSIGKAGLTLLERGQYQQMLDIPGSKLASVAPDAVAESINAVIPKMPTEGSTFTPIVSRVDFIGERNIIQVALFLNREQLLDESLHIRSLLDRMNSRQSTGRSFIPHVSIASVGQVFADNAMLEQFKSLAPETIDLLPAQAISL